jgi:aminodeoxyfutalosine synthase
MLGIAPVRGELADIAAKVERGERLSVDDGVRLYESDDLIAIGQLADLAKRRQSGDQVYFNQNRHINYTNICAAHCSFCGFRRDEGEHGAYVMTVDEILGAAATAGPNVTEFHIVAGNHEGLPFTYYEEMMAALKAKYPHVHIKAFTAVEIWFFHEIYHMSVEDILRRLIDAGLGSMPGGGAEVFSARVRAKICPDKADAEQWLDVHRTAHRLGLKTNATLLYGTIETKRERVEHMALLRELQDETGGFNCFIPLAYQPKLARSGSRTETTAVDDLKTIAISRLMLDNFPHIKAYWIDLGPKVAQVALNFGADDLDGTIVEERISHAQRHYAPLGMTMGDLVQLIHHAGFTPVERDTLYTPLHIYTPEEVTRVAAQPSVPRKGAPDATIPAQAIKRLDRKKKAAQV